MLLTHSFVIFNRYDYRIPSVKKPQFVTTFVAYWYFILYGCLAILDLCILSGEL